MGKRVCIEGVRRISWDRGEMCEFASALTAALARLGDDVPYHYVMGCSGAAFRFSLDPGEWDPGNYGVRNFTADPNEPIRRAVEALGYDYAIHDRGAKDVDAARIAASLSNGVPVLTFGVVGPSDCCVVTGYDEGGEVLLGWSTYQGIPDDHDEPHDATGYFRKTGWHGNLRGYVILGAKGERPPRRATYVGALKWAVHLMRTPAVGRRRTGLEGLRVWAEEMTRDENFPADDESVMAGRYLSTAVNMMMLTDHRSAVPFLSQIAEDESDLSPGLTPAIACFENVGRHRDALDDLIKDDFSEKALRGIADPTIRRAYADVLLQIRAAEAEAAAHVEACLEGR